MPKKKRTSSKKKAKAAAKKKIGGADPRPGLITDEVKAWATSGKLDCKSLKRTLPAVAEGLESGEIDPVVFANELGHAIYVDVARASNMELHRTKDGRKVPMLGGGVVIRLLADLAFGNKKPAKELLAAFCSDLADAYERSAQSVMLSKELKIDTGDEHGNNSSLEEIIFVKEAFDDTCGAWEGRLDLHNGGVGEFRKGCPLYRSSLVYFGNTIGGKVEEYGLLSHASASNTNMDMGKAESIKNCVQLIADEIASGVNRATDTCWECGKVSKSLLICSKCEVAAYCGPDCQLAAWKAKHMKHCKEIKGAYAKYMRGFSVAKAARRKNSIVAASSNTLTPSVWFDLFVVEDAALVNTSVQSLLSKTRGMQMAWTGSQPYEIIGPSIDILHSNLAKLFKGEWVWLFGGALRPCDAKQVDLESVEVDLGRSTKLFYVILNILAYDLREMPGDMLHECYHWWKSGPGGKIIKVNGQCTMNWADKVEGPIDDQYRSRVYSDLERICRPAILYFGQALAFAGGIWSRGEEGKVMDRSSFLKQYTSSGWHGERSYIKEQSLHAQCVIQKNQFIAKLRDCLDPKEEDNEPTPTNTEAVESLHNAMEARAQVYGEHDEGVIRMKKFLWNCAKEGKKPSPTNEEAAEALRITIEARDRIHSESLDEKFM